MTEGLLVAALSAGLVFAALILVRAGLDRNPLIAGIGALIFAGASAGILILASQSRLLGEAGELMELVLTVVVGPVMLLTVARLLHVRMRRWIPPGLGLVGLVVLLIIERRFGGDPIVFAVPLQVSFTICGWVLFFRSRDPVQAPRSRAARLRRIAFWLLLAISTVNLASLVRLSFPDIALLRSIVPWTLGTVFVAFLFRIAWQFLAGQAPTLRRGAEAGNEIADRLVALIEAERLFGDRTLKLEDVAPRLAMPVSALAIALAGSRYGGFAPLLQSVRLEQAQRLLSDPGEAATSIDAVGMLCGFGSRSTFYDAFERRFGVAPGAYRKRQSTLSGG